MNSDLADTPAPAKPRQRREKAPDGFEWPPPRIAVDTREQRPWRWGKLYSGEPDPESLVTELLGGPWYSEAATLGEGDYQLLGPDGAPLEGVCAVERKSMADLRGSLSAGHDRLMREMERLSPWTTPVLIVEAPVEVLLGARSALVDLADGCRVRFMELSRALEPDLPVHAHVCRSIVATIAEAIGHEDIDVHRPGRVSHRSLIGSVLSIMTDHRVPVLFLPSREWAEYAAAWVLRRAWRRWLADDPGRLATERARIGALGATREPVA